MGQSVAQLALPGCYPVKDNGDDGLEKHLKHRRASTPSSEGPIDVSDRGLEKHRLKHHGVSSPSSKGAKDVSVLTSPMIYPMIYPLAEAASKGFRATYSETSNKCFHIDNDGNAYMIDESGTYMLWGWKLFDAGFQKALYKSDQAYIRDECQRIDRVEKQCRDTEEAASESIRQHEVDEQRRQQRLVEAKAQWEEALKASKFQYMREMEERRRRCAVIDIDNTAEMNTKFNLERIPGDGLCLYHSLYRGLRNLDVVPTRKSFPEFLEHVHTQIQRVAEYKNIYKPIFSFTDFETLNRMDISDIRNREINGRIDPLVKMQGALFLSLGQNSLNGRRINREIVWGDHLELFFILKIYRVNAVVFEVDPHGLYLRTQKNLLYPENQTLYLQKYPNHYNLLLPKPAPEVH
mmetsp:Transcript_11673/g.28760  ORF Transcript_11673/g.28760 Transcript_11673/m.28760 type:complete len:406 (-) Transcript_11673:279-1496(-)|eukprot:CAMPEP_0114523818 /NCGR_PEP_ID=MMETSP0109-20121206/21502_1 /TAXON_ID=29199 /ORGANISM="Chlorarachnion reptans, Strain CCCM449" /LENGTH=405 /DNA_ID=CAMNT_0001705175 /DNA_START=126 /DNA_END=1343 /DNA_ORIENTATION=-